MRKIDVRGIDQTQLQMLRGLRHAAPWFVSFFILPLTIWLFRRLWADSPWALALVVILLIASTAFLLYVVRRQTRNRSGFGRAFAYLYTAAPMGYLTAAVAFGVGPIPKSPMFALWAIGSPTLCIAWNIIYRVRQDPLDNVEFAVPVTTAKPKRPLTASTVGKAAKVIAGTVVGSEIVRETGPATAAELPSSQRDTETPSAPSTGRGRHRRRVVSPIDTAEAEERQRRELAELARLEEENRKRAEHVVRGLRRLIWPGSGRFQELSDSQLTVTGASEYATTVVLRVPAGSSPTDFIREAPIRLATHCRLSPPAIRVTPDSQDYSRINIRVAWKNPLANPIRWEGPTKPGAVFGTVPLRISTAEDGSPGHLLLPYSEQYRKNASHVAIEGQNGSGKSELARLIIGDACTQEGVIFWAIDTGKVLQTLRVIAPAIDWFAPDRTSARQMMRAIQKRVIPARGTLLGSLGYDNWVPECWTKHRIPYIVVLVEEGGVIFDALGKAFPEIMMLARSLGISVVGSIQRAHGEYMDTTARAQFSETFSFGVSKIEDAFILPDELSDAGADPSVWKNQAPGMHYHSSPLYPTLEQKLLPRRVHLADKEELARIVAQHGPQMAKLDRYTADALNADGDDDLADVYDSRETGVAVMQRLMAQGGVLLEQPPLIADEPRRETVTVTSTPATQSAPAGPRSDEVVKFEPIKVGLDDEEGALDAAPTGGVDEVGEEGMFGHPAEIKGADPRGEVDLDDIEVEPYGDPDVPPPDLSALEEELGERLLDRPVLDGPDGDPGLLEKPLDVPEGFAFMTPEDFQPSDTREGAKQRLLALLAAKGPGFRFWPSDLYEQLPWVGRSRSWIRQEVTALAEAGVYIERIDDPSSEDDGKYVTTARVLEFRANPELLPTS